MATKYPILLVHGILLKDFYFFKAFGRIEGLLKKAGYPVFTSRIDGFGTVEGNARQLREEILRLLEETGAEKVNLIAHSKGGLDSKHMILAHQMENKVASLTTLCTPHKGSPVATGILKLPHPLLCLISFFIDLGSRIFGDKQPDSYQVCKQLALVQTMEEDTLLISPKVYCQSFSSTLEKGKDDFLMGIPLKFSRYMEKKTTDGMVSTESSRFGTYRGDCTDESVSHSQIVGFPAGKKKQEKIDAFYRTLCRELEDMGF